MDVNRLEIDDVKHELKIRGIPDMTDEEQMKSVLKKLIGLELTTKISMIKETLNVDEEEKECRSKIVELRTQIPQFSGRYNDGRYKKLLARITHLIIRLERLPKSIPQREVLLGEVNDLKFSLNIKAPPPATSKDVQSEDENGEFVEGQNKSNEMSSTASSEINKVHKAYLPVSQWKIVKYTGDNPRISLGNFLLKVQDKCISRHVDDEELFDSASDLFDGTALAYYRYIRNRVNSWSELVVKLREVFQGPYYDERLLEEIKERKQGPNEPITLYLAKMHNYFERLTEPPVEKEKLKIIERNLHPFFLKHLSHVDYNSLIELEEIGKKLERGKKLAEGFNKFSSGMKLEPDLEYRNPYSGGKRKEGGFGRNQNATCWYCHRPGHRYQDCDQQNEDEKSE
uniref:CCHC-type domain-containing protein n=1 Tax=Clastoptera arizonana TaxID=38151 RepID=A0A1B6DWH0_9HEMI